MPARGPPLPRWATMRRRGLWRQGDPGRPGETIGQVMRRLLVEAGVDVSDIVSEERSRSTYENAVEAVKILEEREIDSALLVTDAYHLPRAVRCFQRQGFDVVAAGCNLKATELKASYELFLPSIGALKGVDLAFHEWLGIVWYWLNGRA